MFSAYTRPRYQVSVYRTIGPPVLKADYAMLEMSWITEISQLYNQVTYFLPLFDRRKIKIIFSKPS